MTRHAEVALPPRAEGDSALASSPASSATGRCATWARSADRSPTTTRRRTTRPRCSAGRDHQHQQAQDRADKFFKGLYETALEPGEIITSVSFPVPESAAYMNSRTRRRASRWSACSSADLGGGKVRVGGHRARPPACSADRHGEGAARSSRRSRSPASRCRRAQQRPARLARIPRAPDHRDGARAVEAALK